jgi:hypothetical protein
MSFSYFLLEGQNEDRAKIKLTKADKLGDYEQLLSITAPYKNDPNGKNNKHLPKLVDFYLEGQPLDIIKNYYDRFIKNTKTATKPIDNFNFQQFEQLVDSTATKADVETKKIDDKAVYEDNNVKIYLGTDKASCIKYGQGRKYGFCIARTDNSNLFHGYRAKGATFYFIYFKNREARSSAPEDLIVIHAYPDNQYMINYATPNADHNISEEAIIEKFPALESVFAQGIIKYIPFNQKEEQIYNVINKTDSILQLKTLDDQLLYVEMGKKIKNSEWSKLKNLDEILSKYIEVGSYDIPDAIISNSKYEDRYYDKLRQRAEIKSEGYNTGDEKLEDLIEKLSEDELYIWTYDEIEKNGLNDIISVSIFGEIFGQALLYKNIQLVELLCETLVNNGDENYKDKADGLISEWVNSTRFRYNDETERNKTIKILDIFINYGIVINIESPLFNIISSGNLDDYNILISKLLSFAKIFNYKEKYPQLVISKSKIIYRYISKYESQYPNTIVALIDAYDNPVFKGKSEAEDELTIWYMIKEKLSHINNEIEIAQNNSETTNIISQKVNEIVTKIEQENQTLLQTQRESKTTSKLLKLFIESKIANS